MKDIKLSETELLTWKFLKELRIRQTVFFHTFGNRAIELQKPKITKEEEEQFNTEYNKKFKK